MRCSCTSHFWFLQSFADGFPTRSFAASTIVQLVLSNWRRRRLLDVVVGRVSLVRRAVSAACGELAQAAARARRTPSRRPHRTRAGCSPRRRRRLRRRALRAAGAVARRAVGPRRRPAPVRHGAPRVDDAARERSLARAEDAVARRVDLLGSGPFELGRPIDWLRDPKTGLPLAVRLRAPHRVREPRPAERRQAAVGDLARAVAPPGRPGVPAHRRRALRRSGTRHARRVDRGEPVRGDGQLVGDDGGRAADPLAGRGFSARSGRQRAWRDPGFRGRFLRDAVAARRLHRRDISSAPT